MNRFALALVPVVALMATAPAAFAQETVSTASTTTVAAPQASPKGQALLQGVLGEIVQGKSDFPQMQPTLRVELLQQRGLIPSLTTRLQSFGGLQSVAYAGRQAGMEVYDVRFADASMIWAVGVDNEGKLARVRWRFR